MSKPSIWDMISAHPVAGAETKFRRRATKHLNICFTPRSGSSWLTELLASTQALGKAQEYLNPNIVPGILEKFHASSPSDYLDRTLSRTASENGVASIEVTWFHLQWLARSIEKSPWEGELPSPFTNSAYYVWLRRHDLIAQAVSLYKATETGYFANDGKSEAPNAMSVPYSSKKIKKWCNHILQQEYGFERWFRSRQIKPLRLFYEDTTNNPEWTLQTIANFIELPRETQLNIPDTRHKKIVYSSNDDYIAKFRKEEQDFIDYWAIHRGKLSAL